ncbi:ornithine cyclodeaminase [soil metagenome]
MTLRLIQARELTSLLPMETAIVALGAAFAGPPRGAPPRTHVALNGSDLLLMPARGDGGIGVKLVTVNPDNPGRGLPLIHGAYVLFAPGTLETVGIIDGAALTGLRTAAVSGLATRLLAREDSRKAVIFGAGTQAHAHLDAMRAVRPIEAVTVVSRTAARAERLVERARSLGLSAEAGEAQSVTDADIVCTCTTSDKPVFDGSLLARGAHVNAVGAYRADARELDERTIGGAQLVVVETRESAMEEAGDIVLALASGAIADAGDVAELEEVVDGRRSRQAADDVTVFKSVGVAFEDLAVARAAFDAVLEQEG